MQENHYIIEDDWFDGTSPDKLIVMECIHCSNCNYVPDIYMQIYNRILCSCGRSPIDFQLWALKEIEI